MFQNWTSAQWIEYMLGSLPALIAQISVGFEVFHHVPKGLTHALFSLLSVWWPDEHFRQSTTHEKDSFLPVLFCDMPEKHGGGWPPSPLASNTTLLPAQFLSTSSSLDFQQGCCICNAFSTHWANELCVAKAACNFLMSPCFMAGNMLLPPAPCSSVNTVLHISLDPGSCCRENIITYQQCKAPHQPCSYTLKLVP